MTLESRKILVIDDDAVVRQSIVAYLEDSGFLILEAGHGAKGIELLSQHTPDVVITDLRMPDIDGLTVLKYIRENLPKIPVIVVSGMGVMRDVVDALRLGASDYLVKPLVDMEILVHSINRAVSRSELQCQNDAYRKALETTNRELHDAVSVLERDQRAGRRIQSKFMPDSSVSINGYQLDFKIIPSLYLSGDSIDYGLLADRYLAFYLVDVSGHGAAPAFVTIWLKHLVRRFFREQTLFQDEQGFRNDSVKLLELINDEVINSNLESHLTCFVGVIDTQTNEMQCVYGGHLPFPILNVNGEATYLSGKGKPVGIFAGAQWQVYSVQLPNGPFSLTVFSDGVLEILPELELIEKEKSLLNRLSGPITNIEDICENLMIKDIDSLADDIAILKIQIEKD